MKHLVKIAGLCLASIVVMGMALTATASAAPHWLLCSEGTEKIAPTKYTSSQCTSASTNLEGKWQWNELKGTEKAVTKGSLLLKDTDTLAGETEVECSGESIGSVGPGPFDKIEKVNVSAAQCRAIKGCETVEAIEAIDLPWQTEVTEPKAGELVDLLKGDGKGEPGYKITCKVLKITGQSDECKSAGTESLLLANTPTGSELLVLATFQHLRKGVCTKSLATNKESGEVLGSLANLVIGHGLRVSS